MATGKVNKHIVTLNVDDTEYTVLVQANTTLLNVLRDDLDLTGTKKGCELGDCGTCTVLMDGKPVNACLVLALEAEGHEIMTVEGVADGNNLSVLQKKMIECGGIQCGYCTSGMIMSGTALLKNNPNPSEEEVREAIAGNLCRCTGYVFIVKAILEASKELQAQGGGK